MTSFLSTFVNKIDKKGRVSVPAPFRASLASEIFSGVIAYPSLIDPAIDVFGRSTLEELNRRRLHKNMDDGDFEKALLGHGDPIIDTIMALSHELPFDGQGRIILPQTLIDAANLVSEAVFVGRGNRIQVWNPENFISHQNDAVSALREKLKGRIA